MALRAVVLPAPFGPIKPRIRPSSTRRSMPSKAMVEPKVLRSPRASMQAMGSVFLSFDFRWRFVGAFHFEQFFWFQPEALNGGLDCGPLFGEKLLSFALEQEIAGTGFNEETEAATFFDEFL